MIPISLIEKLITTEYVAILTGAGVSAESGIRTFRDPDGLWAKFNPMELASVDGFMNNPELVWGWYQHRRQIIDESAPNPGHLAIAEMQKLFGHCSIITQNVDRLHQQAGAEKVIELHGNIIDNHCIKCKKPYLDEIDIDTNYHPNCKHCDGKIRPSVVWFGEMLPEDAIHSAEIAAMQSEVFFSAGTSSEVYPAANLPFMAKSAGAIVVEINPNSTPLSRYADYKITEKTGIAFPEIVRLIKERKGISK